MADSRYARLMTELTNHYIHLQRMKLDIKSAWTICPSTINFVLSFSTFDLPLKKILFLPNSMRTRMNAYRGIAARCRKPGCGVGAWLCC